MTFACRSCYAELGPHDVTVQGELVVCLRCGVDCRCPPEGGVVEDPIELMDLRWWNRAASKRSVREQLAPLPWGDTTIGALLDHRCCSSRYGQFCERETGHKLPHRHGDIEWGGRAA